MRARRGVGATVLKGAIAGAVATWVMNRATTWMYNIEPDAAREREEKARGGQTAYATAAASIGQAIGLHMDREQQSKAGTAIHWATGIAAGAAYAVLRERWPTVTKGSGLGYGAGFFLAVDEMLNPLLGLTPGPAAFPWHTHGRGLAGHLTFGSVNEWTLRLLDRAA